MPPYWSSKLELWLFILFAVSPAVRNGAAASPHLPPSDNQTAQSGPILQVIALATPTRAVKMDSATGETNLKLVNNVFVEWEKNGHVCIRDRNGHITANVMLQPQSPGGESSLFLMEMHDVAVFSDGSLAASFAYMFRGDRRRYFFLIHFTSAGEFIENMDLGISRASKICIAKDQSVWTLSSQEEFGHLVFFPDEGVLRNYKFGSGLLGSFVTRSHFPSSGNDYASNGSALDCGKETVHALTGDHQWVAYSKEKGAQLSNIEGLDELFDLIHLGEEDQAYGMVLARSGQRVKRMFAKLVPSANGTTLHWQEVVLNLPGGRCDLAEKPPANIGTAVVVTDLLGEDDADGKQLVYRISANEMIFWSTPQYEARATKPSCDLN